MSKKRNRSSRYINRRQFIAQSSRLAGGALTGAWFAPLLLGGCASTKQSQSDRKPQSNLGFDSCPVYDCIVLGAGMAGLTAARTLQDLNPSISVLVLEGADRIGGRMCTDRTVFGGPIELGAEYIHRHPGSVPLWHEIERYGLQTIPVPKRSKALVYWHERGQAKLMNMNALKHHVSLCAKLDLLEVMRYHRADISGEMFLSRHHLKGMSRYMVQLALNGHLPARLEDLSILGYHADCILDQLRELNDYSVVEGYDSIIQRMAQGVEIRTGHPVALIRRTPSGVEVVGGDGRIFRARSAVITFSINMLKSGLVRFEPELPDEKLEAIAGLEMGDVAKTILQFNQAFWPQDMSMLHWPGDGRESGRTFFHDFYGRPNLPPTLTSFLVGETAENMQGVSDLDLIARICRDLDQVFPDAAPTLDKVARAPDGRMLYLRKHWAKDPWALGGYSFLRYNPGSKIPVQKVRHILKDPSSTLPLFWAGEATSVLTQPASVHGANSSGIEAANAVHAYLAKQVLPTSTTSDASNGESVTRSACRQMPTEGR